MPPARGTKPAAATRGLTHTIRYASRASRSISRPTSCGLAALPAVGEDHDHRAAGHPAAAVAVVERAQRVADAGAARPVGRGRGGALDRALGRARGERARDARQPRGEHERLGVGLPRARQELQVRARVGLHRAADVAQQHEPPRHDARGAGARGGSGRRPCAARRAACAAGRCARRGGRARRAASGASASRARIRVISR